VNAIRQDFNVKSVCLIFSIGSNERLGRLKFLFRRLEKRADQTAKDAARTFLGVGYSYLLHVIDPPVLWLKHHTASFVKNKMGSSIHRVASVSLILP
jgi:hypothetical protein